MARIDDSREARSLTQAWRVFVAHRSPRILLVFFSVLVGLRLRLWARGQGFEWPELASAALILAVLWPLQEWALHRYLLHLRPMEIGGRRFDPEFARRHRAHHREPNFIPDILLPLGVIVPLIPVVIGLWWWVMPTPALGLSAMAAYAGAALAYEWIHYLTHTAVKPSSAWFRRVRRNHRYHHYKNERYWLGFTLPIVDTLLGTNPKPGEVETSATARDLLGDDGEDP